MKCTGLLTARLGVKDHHRLKSNKEIVEIKFTKPIAWT